MKRTADIFTWSLCIAAIIILWITAALAGWAFSFINWPNTVLYIIAGVYTVISLAIAIIRQIVVNKGESKYVVALGVLTFIFVSEPGGILTIIYGKTVCNEYVITYDKIKVQKDHSSDEYIYTKPESTDQIKVGDIVQIKEGFYDSNAQRRFSDNTFAEVIEINGSNVKLSLIAGSARFDATTQISNILVKTVNPDYIKKHSAPSYDVNNKKDEFLYIEPNSNNQIAVGSVVKVKSGFYAEAVKQRVQKDEICEVTSIDGDNIEVLVVDGQMKYKAVTKARNLLLRIDNPYYEK